MTNKINNINPITFKSNSSMPQYATNSIDKQSRELNSPDGMDEFINSQAKAKKVERITNRLIVIPMILGAVIGGVAGRCIKSKIFNRTENTLWSALVGLCAGGFGGWIAAAISAEKAGVPFANNYDPANDAAVAAYVTGII